MREGIFQQTRQIGNTSNYMKSKLFQKLAQLTGISLFNWKEKIAHAEVRVFEPTTDPDRMYRQNYVYFKRITAQAQLIDVMRKIIDSYDFEVEKWDTIQAGHESEIAHLKFDHDQEIDTIKSMKIKPYVLDLERQVKSLRDKNEGQVKQIKLLELTIANAKQHTPKPEKKVKFEPSSDRDKAEIIRLTRELDECNKRLKVQHRMNELLTKQKG